MHAAAPWMVREAAAADGSKGGDGQRTSFLPSPSSPSGRRSAIAAVAAAGGQQRAWGARGVGYAHHEAMPPSTVCMEKGLCYKKQLTCPPKCFKSFSFKDKHGGGGCSFDCNKCVATC
uniref:Uncharacterized protein n=1 Tax=Leersia perrieri TaxID=77586 RepID=A0A0D9VAN4_9ORYZ